MCGIAGAISWDGRHRVEETTLRRMAARIAHRGPDGETITLLPPQPVAGRAQMGFAFRRLAVLDPDPRAMQPMRSPDGRYTIVFNGEIYNYRELQQRMPGREWRTTGDTEILLAALAAWGTDITLERLDGMFALAVWDAAEQTLLLARDRMGQKPLYFTTGDGDLAFASELGALKEWPHWDRAIDDESLAHYLRYGYVLAPRTIYRDVAQLAPGTRLIVRAGTASTAAHTLSQSSSKWFNLERDAPAELTARSPKETREVIESAVRSQLVSDVPLGVFLSGGIDSSIVALAARRANGVAGATKTFSIGFDDPRYDESSYAEAVAKHLGTEHQTFRVTPDIAADLPKLASVFGEPFGDSSALPTHWLSQQTRKHVTVALSGDGGDELFGGYDRYRALAAPIGLLKPLAAVGRKWEAGHPKSRRTRAGRLLASAGLSVTRRYDRYISLFGPELASELMHGRPTFDATMNFAPRLYTFGGPVEAALAFDRATYLPGDLLTKVDRCSMLHALEVRSPFMSPSVLAYANSLRKSQLFAGGPKRLLREAFAKELPAEVFKRKKMGFAVPIGDWFRGPLKSLLRDHVLAASSFARSRFDMSVVERLIEEHESERRDHAQRLYALLMLELWWAGESRDRRAGRE
ncbi:MAG: asnB 1 [Phycisphaerales bacterium]|nr:asnB 1 [Phycisphaerales bacterium]